MVLQQMINYDCMSKSYHPTIAVYVGSAHMTAGTNPEILKILMGISNSVKKHLGDASYLKVVSLIDYFTSPGPLTERYLAVAMSSILAIVFSDTPGADTVVNKLAASRTNTGLPREILLYQRELPDRLSIDYHIRAHNKGSTEAPPTMSDITAKNSTGGLDDFLARLAAKNAAMIPTSSPYSSHLRNA